MLIHTPYYRRFAMAPGSEGDASRMPESSCDMLVPRGYALVVVDVRGTGASFGTRDSFRSPKERDDAREIADWIVAQPWSDGASARPASPIPAPPRTSWPAPGIRR
jgi:putative CocE/NonD family hydrolase